MASRTIRIILPAFILFQIFACYSANIATGETVPQQTVPRTCTCDELDECYKNQTIKRQTVSTQCRQLCSIDLLLANETVHKVSECYDVYDHSRSNVKAQKQQCVERLGSRRCTPSQHSAPPTTVTIDLSQTPQQPQQSHGKRNYKILYPAQITAFASCMKRCRKNRSSAQSCAQSTGTKQQKQPRIYEVCALQQNCQLLPVDKRLEKQTKEICKLQNQPREDSELNLCTCLENALQLNLQCTQMANSPGTASSESCECDSSQT